MCLFQVVEDLSDSEQAHGDDDEVEAVRKKERIEGEPCLPREYVATYRRKQQTDSRRHQRFERIATANSCYQIDTDRV